MPFKKVNIKEKVENKIKCDSEFAEAYERISVEYDLIQKAIQMRKEIGYSQEDVAISSGLKQQNISRIEKVGSSPTLRNFLRYLDGIGLEVKLEKKRIELEEEKAKVESKQLVYAE